MAYPSLDAEKIEETIVTLEKRINERFPGRGLAKLCGQLHAIAREDRERLAWVARPNLWLRAGVAVAMLVGLAGLLMFASTLLRMEVTVEAFAALQGIDAAVNTIALAGAASWFLINLETVWRRRAVLNDLHELRSIAHVVDMHQLTKDPTTISKDYVSTASSQAHNMTVLELVRYLDYCSEMLSITGKLAALYMQNVRDPVIIEAVNEIEDLTTGLSRKIWQKIMILTQPDSAPPTLS
jgi:hypothetical protein